MFVSLRDKKPGSAFLFCFITGILFFSLSMYWITTTVTQYGDLHFTISLFLNLLLGSYLALYFGLFGLLFAYLKRLKGINAALIAAPGLWITVEWLRGFIFTGFPWNLAAYSQYLFLPVIQTGEFFGPYGLSWLIIAVNSSIVYIIFNKEEKSFQKKFAYPAIVMVLFLVNLIYGLLAIDRYPKESETKIALIQGNANMEQWRYNECEENLKKHLQMVIQAGRVGADLSVLSETSLRCFGFYPPSNFCDWMQKLSTESRVDIIFGSSTSDFGPDGKSRYYNSAVLLKPDGSKPQIYSKVHLVPFGEYIPYQKILFFVDKFSKGVIGNFSPGKKFNVLTMTNGHKFGIGICYEILFPELMRKFTANGAEFLVNITNDTWYGDTVMPRHHFSFSVFRAVENRKYIIRSANSGISGIVAPDGRILEKSNLFTETIICRNIHPNQIITFYAKYGDWLVYLNVLILLIYSIGLLKKRLAENSKTTIENVSSKRKNKK